jgi:hypothetical protein
MPAPSVGTHPAKVPYAKTGVTSFYFEGILLQRLLFQKTAFFLLLLAMPMKGLRRNNDPERKKSWYLKENTIKS